MRSDGISTQKLRTGLQTGTEIKALVYNTASGISGLVLLFSEVIGVE